MNQIFFSALARDDLQSIWEFIVVESPQGAKKVIEKIHANIIKLSTFPKLGPQRKDITEKNVRFLVVHHYLIVYRIEKDSIEIIRILSGFRDIASLIS